MSSNETFLGMPAMPVWLEKRRAEADNTLMLEEDHGMPGPQRYAQGNDVYRLTRDWDDESENGLTRDIAFNRHSMNDGHHVSPFDNRTIAVGTDGIEVALVQGINEEDFRRTLSAATRATIGIDIDQPAALDPDKDWEEMLKGGLQTALESQVIVFAVKGASRTATHQLVRSRRAAFHQQSQRASYMGDYPEVRMPESVWRNKVARAAFLHAVVQAHRAYRMICEEDISYQDARFILPEGTNNFILLEYPVREFLNVYAYRGCSMFQWELVQIMRLAKEALIEAHPWLEPHVKITCEKTGVCEFQGWEVVEGQCDFPQATEDNRRFKPIHHRIARGGAS